MKFFKAVSNVVITLYKQDYQDLLNDVIEDTIVVPLVHFDKELYHDFMLHHKYFNFFAEVQDYSNERKKLYDYIQDQAEQRAFANDYFAVDVLLPEIFRKNMENRIHIEGDEIYTVLRFGKRQSTIKTTESHRAAG